MTRSPMTLADAQAQAASFIEARSALHADFRMEADADPKDDASKDDPADDPKDAAKPDETPEAKAARLESELAEATRHSRTWEARAKANKPKADQWDAAEAAKATPDQKLTAAEQRAATAERELARFRVAAATGLPADLADLLNGDDEEAMTTQAKKILALKGDTPKPKPKPDPTQGGSGGTNKPSEADIGRAEAQRRHAKK